MILWKEEAWTIGSLFLALQGAGITGPVKRSTNPTLPRNAARWAVDHFQIPDGDGWRYIETEKSFRGNWKKGAASHDEYSRTFTKILINLHIN